MKIRARVVTKLPASLQAAGGLKVEKQNGRWTFGPDWNVLALETSLPDAAGRHLWTLNPITGVYTRLSVQALIDNLPIGPAGEDGALIFVQNDAPDTDNPENSIWIDADSTDYDLYQLVASTWTDTGVNLKGATGNPGANGVSPAVFVQNDAPGTSYPEGSLWIDADSANNDLYQLQSGSWVDTGVNLKGADGAGTGDVTSDTATSVDGEIALFKGTTGKEIKRFNGTGILKATSGVIGAASAGTDYLEPGAIGVTVQPYDPTVFSPETRTMRDVTGATDTLILTDAGNIVVGARSSGNLAITVPPNGDVAFPNGTQIDIQGSGVTIKSEDSKKKLNKQNSPAVLLKRGTDTWMLFGSLKS
jgi:hypothetical protein